MSLAPGWYRDPADPTTQRWWDGEGWVGDPLPADETPPPGPPPETNQTGSREPQVPAVPGLPGAAETPIPPPEPGRPPEQVPPGWPYRHAAGRSTSEQQGTPRPHGLPLASLGSRLLARLIDIGMVFLLNVVVNGWFVFQYWQEIAPFLRETWRRSLAGEDLSDLPTISDDAGTYQLVILILAAALWFAYEVPSVANTGQTLGKRLLRIKVVRLESSEPLGFGRSIRRWNTQGLPVLLWWCFGIGFLLQLLDALFVLIDRPLQQALHDKSAFTAVVSVPADHSEETRDESADPS